LGHDKQEKHLLKGVGLDKGGYWEILAKSGGLKADDLVGDLIGD